MFQRLLRNRQSLSNSQVLWKAPVNGVHIVTVTAADGTGCGSFGIAVGACVCVCVFLVFLVLLFKNFAYFGEFEWYRHNGYVHSESMSRTHSL